MWEGFRISKEEKPEEWFKEVAKRADIIDSYDLEGFYVLKPFSVYLLYNMKEVFDKELQGSGHEPSLFPSIIPERNIRKLKEHWEGFNKETYWISEVGNSDVVPSERLCLTPTGECAIYPSYSAWIRKYGDLPLKLYQFRTQFRYEARKISPLLRQKEFSWIESHDVFASKEETERQIAEDMKIVSNVLTEHLGIPVEFVRRPHWVTFPGADETYNADIPLVNGRVIQIASTHVLGQNFSKVFDIKFMDRNGEQHYAWQTCLGIGMTRILCALLMIHGDEDGLVLPFEIAPIQVAIISRNNDDATLSKIEDVKNILEKKNIRVSVDQSECTVTEKRGVFEIRGVPICIEIDTETLPDHVCIYRRDLREKIVIEIDKLGEKIDEFAEKILNNLKKRAEEKFADRLIRVTEYDDLAKKIEEGFIVKAPFCSMEDDGKECDTSIQEQLNAYVRGTPLKREKPSQEEKCIVCGKRAKEIVYIARELDSLYC